MFEPNDFTCYECKHTEFCIAYSPSNDRVKNILPQDFEFIGKPDTCQKCQHNELHAQMFWWRDLPKDFVIDKINHLKNNLSLETLYKVARLIGAKSLRSPSQRMIVGEFYLKSARLSSKKAMFDIINFYLEILFV